MENTTVEPVSSCGIAGHAEGLNNPFWTSFMSRKFFFLFLICILCFIVSEYYLLQELYNFKRPSILWASISGIGFSLFCFWFFYKKFRKIAK